ncbi:carbohydrate ABC transporter permease [Spelaeicoccus albus]|uniref:Multiple sugar transport system permease protein n=1 Tax=Spelaeicoccus albus TaxID=1280376 RepID=A0A7Z0A953_9MICO|nr:sugar ABC transporter permease [Spelaeicoccus albus]NYI66617.1 multiple sugar transport system permease protein [Spelaeicoccus albus]
MSGLTDAPSRRATAPANRRMRRRRQSATGYSLLAPSLIGVGIFLIVPAIVSVWLSFHSWDLVSKPTWAGLANFGALFTDPAILNSFGVTLLFVIIVIPCQTALGLWLSVLLAKRLRGSTFFRAVFLIPWICAPLALGVVWKWIFAPTGGALNTILGTHVAWLSSYSFALPSVAFVSIWTNVGYVTLFFLAGLSNIPGEFYESARLDGATGTQVFWSITVPLLRPTMFFVLVTGFIASFQAFDQIYSMTAGGPAGRTDVVATHIYQDVFLAPQLGSAAALSLALMVVLVLVTLAQNLFFRRRMTYGMQ